MRKHIVQNTARSFGGPRQGESDDKFFVQKLLSYDTDICIQDWRYGRFRNSRGRNENGHALGVGPVRFGGSFVYDRRLVSLMRDPSITEKVSRKSTGLKSNLYIHVRFDDFGRIAEIQITEQGKDGSTLDRILIAIGEALSNICDDVNAEKK